MQNHKFMGQACTTGDRNKHLAWILQVRIGCTDFFLSHVLCVHRNHSFSGDAVEHATRFIALAKAGNSLKHKWLYAFSLIPIDQMRATDLYQETTDQTDCPYTAIVLQSRLSSKQVNWKTFQDALKVELYITL